MARTNRLTVVFMVGCLFLVPLCDAYCYSSDVRLVGGSNSYEGRVEICHNNIWGTVCDDSWDDNDARVVCQQLGLPTTWATHYSNAYFGQGSGQIWLDDVNCDGYESRLSSCSSPSFGSHDCSHSEDAGVSCGSTNGGYCSDGDVRLVGSSSSNAHQGRVEICHNNEWGTVCDDYWDNDDARVVCRQLGLPTEGATAYSNAHFGRGSGQIWLDQVSCDGYESRLIDCYPNSYGYNYCNHGEDAGVRCGGSSCSSSTGEDCGTLYGLVIGGSIGGVLLVVCLPIIIISIVSCISKRKRRAVRVTQAGRTRSTGQAYRQLQQYPPPTTTVVSTSNQAGMASEPYSTPMPFYQFQHSGVHDSFASTEHAQFDVPNEDPPPYSKEADPLIVEEAEQHVDEEAPLINNMALEEAGDGHQLEFNLPPPVTTTATDTTVVVEPEVQSSCEETV